MIPTQIAAQNEPGKRPSAPFPTALSTPPSGLVRFKKAELWRALRHKSGSFWGLHLADVSRDSYAQNQGWRRDLFGRVSHFAGECARRVAD
jgi:hypothetical protein